MKRVSGLLAKSLRQIIRVSWTHKQTLIGLDIGESRDGEKSHGVHNINKTLLTKLIKFLCSHFKKIQRLLAGA